ncbi:bifunctional folylpolyglutamate synthase/dihydrofolate synthase [Mediannikoviicoccus vaginalis]|uniref:bifunctional folylpolyglutamate synthase/dihydrofolate synthase n=1 Tax=Mediannikoviicoccus vaginalis TaxID=2899727 RepID=UPI001F2DD9A8|nr:folylpolyglutamate synthase/dihydrofolate synthase family protein [Mediannikoviicoccus vaginalis]
MKNKEILDISNDKKAYNGAKNIEKVLELLGNPQDELNIIHVAGTNGKGSVCNFISNALEENGYKVGLYTSPAIFSNSDRFQINHNNIDDKRLLRYYDDIKSLAKENNITIHEFDIATIIAFLYFYEEECDFAVIEVGIGGRVDSTNVIKKSVASVILKIGMDHMELLGNSLEEIAYEKAGIIKESGVVVYYPQEIEVNKVIEKEASIKNAKVIVPDFENIKDYEISRDSHRFSYDGYEFKLNLHSEVQRYNAVVAFEVLKELKISFNISLERAIKGINKTTVSGRYEIVNRDPIVIIDGSHNPQAVKSLRDTLLKDFPDSEFVFVVGFYKDKDYRELLDINSDIAYGIICCDSGSERSLPSHKLSNVAREFSDRVYDMKTVEKALDFAKNKFSDKIIVVYGSFSLVSKGVKYFKGVTNDD